MVCVGRGTLEMRVRARACTRTYVLKHIILIYLYNLEKKYCKSMISVSLERRRRKNGILCVLVMFYLSKMSFVVNISDFCLHQPKKFRYRILDIFLCLKKFRYEDVCKKRFPGRFFTFKMFPKWGKSMKVPVDLFLGKY